ncbi:hypothetical protein L3Q65_38150 [Amycolatopsis sp. FU40]|uniref:hypothetical protein n=1 Tax=Amycolatopsis sp. FU40 TaxID=2914159 RepID=UPI001F3028A8|nr:hypothetical protein [Amycolatopsis sp. FU40]UKD53669.1 hypothetical protein L3Q65_38150 [Amycolatopsis sp. FU40]
MTATLPVLPENLTATEAVYLWGDGYQLTARDIVNTLASYLVTFGDNIGPKLVSPLSALHSEYLYGNPQTWTDRRTPTEVATARARAEAIARDFFGDSFPVLAW